MTLEFTGERFLTECQGEMVYEHWHRYFLAREYSAGKRVLDVASGEGYGSNLLANVALSVTGVDISPDAVRHANEKYAQPNLQYIAASCTQIPLPDASFDFIVSFETIEHIDADSQRAFLSEVNRLLTADGVFLVSSPNRPEYSDKTGYKNEYHVQELDKAELEQQLSEYWPDKLWLAQRPAFHSIIWPINVVAQQNWVMDDKGVKSYPEPLYFLVFCARSAAQLSTITPALSLLADRENSVYAEWSRTYRENRELREEVDRLRLDARTDFTTDAPSAITAPAHSSASAESWLVRLARRLAP